MKSNEQLRRLQSNPFYTLTDAEKQQLEAEETTDPKAEVAPKAKKQQVSSKGNAAVKETGKIEKHSTDPISE